LPTNKPHYRSLEDYVGGSRHLRVAVLVFFLMLLLYLLTLSHNYNGDGLGYARIVESNDSGRLFSVSARLLFCPTGKLVLTVADLAGIDVRSVTVLQVVNSIFGAAGAGILFLAAFRISRSVRISLIAALGLGFSLSYWFWITNATSYPGNIFLLTLTLFLLVKLISVEDKGKYIKLSVLIGFTHALAGFYWLTAILLLPAVFLSVLIAGASMIAAYRIRAALAYLVSFAIVLFTPLLIAGISTGNVHTAEDFPKWLMAASYGIGPELNLLNLSRGIIGFSASVFHLVDIGPVVKKVIWGVPFRVDSQVRLYIEVVVFAILWLFIIFMAGYLFRFRKNILNIRKRLIAILTSWIAIPTVFGAIWLGSDTERWLSVLPVLWLFVLFVVMHGREFLSHTRRRTVEAVIWGFLIVLFVNNIAFSILPDRDIDNNHFMLTAQSLNERMNEDDIVFLWGHDHVFTADHLTYFFSLDAIHIGQVGRERPDQAFNILEQRMTESRIRGGRIYVTGRIFLSRDLPESHVSEEELNISREEYCELFTKWIRREAFTIGKDTYWELLDHH